MANFQRSPFGVFTQVSISACALAALVFLWSTKDQTAQAASVDADPPAATSTKPAKPKPMKPRPVTGSRSAARSEVPTAALPVAAEADGSQAVGDARAAVVPDVKNLPVWVARKRLLKAGFAVEFVTQKGTRLRKSAWSDFRVTSFVPPAKPGGKVVAETDWRSPGFSEGY